MNLGGLNSLGGALDGWAVFACLIMLAVLLYNFRDSYSSASTRCLIILDIMCIIALWGDRHAVTCMGTAGTKHTWMLVAGTYLTYLIYFIMPWFTNMYIRALAMEKGKKPIHWLQGLWNTVAVLQILMLTFSQFYHYFYYFDSDNNLIQGPYFEHMRVVRMITLPLVVMTVYAYRKCFDLSQNLTLMTYAVFPAIGLCFQLMIPTLPVLNLSVVVSMGVMVINAVEIKSGNRSEDTLINPGTEPAKEILRETYRAEDEGAVIERRLSRKHIFIINPQSGRAVDLSLLRRALNQVEGLEYYVFTSSVPGEETELTHKIQHYFSEGIIRIYCCGGSGTVRNVLEGIEDFSRIELAVYPCGMTNDFLKVFKGSEEMFKDIRRLIDGQAKKIDYIRTNHGLALNTLSGGFDPRIVENIEKYRDFKILGKMMPYFMAIFASIVFSRPKGYEVILDGLRKRGDFSEIYFGNGGVLGGSMHFFENPDVRDGRAEYALLRGHRGIRMLEVATALARRSPKVPKIFEMGRSAKVIIRKEDNSPFKMNLDGEIPGEFPEWTAEIVSKGLNFVIPEGMKYEG